MTRRIVTAREQYEMLAPWRVAAEDPSEVALHYTDQLFDEFHDWAANNKIPVMPLNKADWGDYSKPMNGPLSYWDNVEAFLKDKYPAAHRDFRFGEEEASKTLDGRRVTFPPSNAGMHPSYETGPDAVAKHGYDPRQVAAGMMYLHSKSHSISRPTDRADLLPRDINRLVDIFDKRRQMQDAYKQQPVTASVDTASRDGWLLREAIRLATPWRMANSGNGGVDPNVNMRRQVTRADARAQEARQRGEHDLADYLEGLRDHMVGEADKGYPRPWSHYEPMAHEEFDIHTGAASVICQNCGQPKDKHSKEHGNGKQHGTCPDNSGQWRPPPGHTPSQTTKSQEKQRAHSAAVHPQSHPDLHESFARHGSVHTTGGRVLSGWRLAAILAAFDDPAGWTFHTSFEPSQHALQGARAYSSLVGLPDPHDGTVDYLSARRSPDELRAAAQNYDSLPLHDAGAVPHFEAMRREMSQQHDFLVNRLGIKTQTVDHDPYSDVHEMLADINNNKRLKVMGTHVTGGHPYFSDDENDKFRAVHDFFGHAATGRSFDRHGEQAAYLAHAQMFSPHARPALASETKGQNSSLIFNGDFGPQKIATMDPVHWAHDLSNLGRTARRRMTGLLAGRDEDLHEYRNERHRQEVELERITGGHPADIADHFARGGTPLITYKDWLRSRAMGPGEQAASEEEFDPDYVHVPGPGWDDGPLW